MAENYPTTNSLEYVRDRNGVIWRVVRDGGMVTTADFHGLFSAGIEWLRQNYGPLETIPTLNVP